LVWEKIEVVGISGAFCDVDGCLFEVIGYEGIEKKEINEVSEGFMK
jgi:hypothetical protein